MIIDFNKIGKSGLVLDQDIEFEEKYYKNTIIKGLKDIHVNGSIKNGLDDELIIDCALSGKMILVDSYTNELIDYPFNCEINEIINENNEFTLDLKEFLWQNIVLEVPIRTSKTDKVETLEGDGWSLVDENSKKDDPRLNVFKEMLEERK